MREIKQISELEQLTRGEKPVLLDFYADWCGPCQALLPVVDQLADKHKENFEIVKINIDQSKDLAQKYAVRSIPALFFLKDGEVKEKLVGYQNKNLLDAKIRTYV